MEFIKKYFRIEERGTTIGKELLGGLTTFLTMAYILFANPSLMGGVVSDGAGGTIQLVAGLDLNAVFLATALAAGLATLAMGLFARIPVALAPGMGLNAFFSFTIVVNMGYSWEEALAAVLVSGALYLVVTLTGLRQKIVNAIPQSLKYAIGAGIGFNKPCCDSCVIRYYRHHDFTCIKGKSSCFLWSCDYSSLWLNSW